MEANDEERVALQMLLIKKIKKKTLFFYVDEAYSLLKESKAEV